MKTESLTEPEHLATRVALHPFLAGMSRTHLALLTDCAIAAHFKKGQTILREGDFANRFYLIESGKVVLESGEGLGEPVVVDAIGPGDLLGWSWMFPPYVWHFTARAVEPAEAIFFYGTILREYCERDPSLGYQLFKRMTPVMLRRLQAARKKMLSIHAHGEQLVIEDEKAARIQELLKRLSTTDTFQSVAITSELRKIATESSEQEHRAGHRLDTVHRTGTGFGLKARLR
jgi:CRP/FNR family cyclic AMP-dependent transcriptional regulator